VTRRAGWRIAFLTTTALAIGEELYASLDGNGSTEPWTDLVVRYVPWEAAVALLAALLVWLPIHFYARYRRRTAYLREEDQGR
jgi:hypothetical protein